MALGEQPPSKKSRAGDTFAVQAKSKEEMEISS